MASVVSRERRRYGDTLDGYRVFSFSTSGSIDHLIGCTYQWLGSEGQRAQWQCPICKYGGPGSHLSIRRRQLISDDFLRMSL